jgi:hypothetical protein
MATAGAGPDFVRMYADGARSKAEDLISRALEAIKAGRPGYARALLGGADGYLKALEVVAHRDQRPESEAGQ